MDQPQSVSIDFAVGFGIALFEPGTVVGSETKRLVYRFVPAPLWGAGFQENIAHINRAANAFESYDQIPSDLKTPVTIEPAPKLTAKGWALYQTFPIYAELELGEGTLKWTQYWPDGTEAYVGEGTSYEKAIDAALKTSPIEQWADLFLGDLRQMITPLPNGAQPSIQMCRVEGSDPPLVAESEAIIRPLGPRKIMKISCKPSRVAACKRMSNFNEHFQLRQCAMALRNAPGEPWHWQKHHIWWFDMPLQFLPRMLRWIEAEKVGDPAPYATRSIAPASEPLVPEVRLNGDPDPRPWDMVAVFFQPLSEIGKKQRGFQEDLLEKLVASR